MATASWQVFAAYLFALAGGLLSTSLRLEHKQLCALISFAAGTLLSVTLFAILPESLNYSGAWFVIAAGATGYVLFYFISKYVHHVCPACAARHFDWVLARLDHGARWRRVHLPGDACCSWRNVEARKETRSGKFCGRHRTDRRSEYCFEAAWIARCASRSEAATVIGASLPVSQRRASL